MQTRFAPPDFHSQGCDLCIHHTDVDQAVQDGMIQRNRTLGIAKSMKAPMSVNTAAPEFKLCLCLVINFSCHSTGILKWGLDYLVPNVTCIKDWEQPLEWCCISGWPSTAVTPVYCRFWSHLFGELPSIRYIRDLKYQILQGVQLQHFCSFP